MAAWPFAPYAPPRHVGNVQKLDRRVAKGHSLQKVYGDELYSLDSSEGALATIERAGGLGIVLVDACRSPELVSASAKKGKSPMQEGMLQSESIANAEGLFVGFAAAYGKTAEQGSPASGSNSPFTYHLAIY